MFLTIIVFIFIIGLVVFVHELGHFIAAKKSGVKVEEFAFGFKPKIFGIKRGETLYAINAIPLGGYIKMLGEGESVKEKRSFSEKPKWIKLIILVSGVTMNFITCWIIFLTLYIVGFEPLFLPDMGKSKYVTMTEPVKIVKIEKGSPAELQGLKEGDIVIKVNGHEAKTFVDTTMEIYYNLGEPIDMQVRRNNQDISIEITARQNPPEGQGPLGIELTSGNLKTKWYWAPWVAIEQTVRMAKMTIITFGGLLKNLIVEQKASENVSGLVGVGVVTGLVRRLGFAYIMQFVGLICASLAVINLVPIVPMDGGHVFVLGIEAVRKKRLTDKQVEWMAIFGLIFILLLFVIVTYNDIIKFDIWGQIKALF